MKISFVTTVLNEEKAIDEFLGSLSKQTRKPNEIIIVDGGSGDRTVASIKYYVLGMKYKGQFKIITKPGNRSVGRNEGIRQATGDIIVCSDAGCIIGKNWVKNIIEPFLDPKIDFVSGFYKPITNNIFEKCLATYTCVMPDRVDPQNFLPSSRSVAFKKGVWQKSSGYPEWLDTCEDLYFAKKLKQMGFKFAFARDALVFWPQCKNLWRVFRQFFNYAVGDGQALFTSYSVHRPKIILLLGRFLLVILLIVFSFRWPTLLFAIWCLLLIYLFWAIFKNYHYVNSWRAVYILPQIQLTADAAVLIGVTYGVLKLVSKNHDYRQKNFS